MAPAGDGRRAVAGRHDGAATRTATSPSSRARIPTRRRRGPLHDRRPRRLATSSARSARAPSRRSRSGSCAFDGGAPGGGRRPDRRRRASASSCPAASSSTCRAARINVENLTATIVHYLTFKELPAHRRPAPAATSPTAGSSTTSASGAPTSSSASSSLAWGDEGAQKGWCLYKMGCKGPETFANCPTERYADGTSWPVKAGHGCVGCTMPGFWDAMSPFYRRLPPPVPFAADVTVDQVGRPLVGRRRGRHRRPRCGAATSARGGPRAAERRAAARGRGGRGRRRRGARRPRRRRPSASAAVEPAAEPPAPSQPAVSRARRRPGPGGGLT